MNQVGLVVNGAIQRHSGFGSTKTGGLPFFRALSLTRALAQPPLQRKQGHLSLRSLHTRGLLTRAEQDFTTGAGLTRSASSLYTTMASSKPVYTCYIAQTVDGYIAEKDGGVAFLSQFEQPGVDYGYGDFVANIDVCVMGRLTFEQVMSFPVPWPYANQRSYVLTRGGTKHELPPNVQTHAGPVSALVDEINKAGAKRVWVIGGAQYVVRKIGVVRDFLDEGLLDELEIYVMPVLLHEGHRLFVDPKKADLPLQKLELIETKALPLGAVKLLYKISK